MFIIYHSLILKLLMYSCNGVDPLFSLSFVFFFFFVFFLFFFLFFFFFFFVLFSLRLLTAGTERSPLLKLTACVVLS